MSEERYEISVLIPSLETQVGQYVVLCPASIFIASNLLKANCVSVSLASQNHSSLMS